MHLNDPDESNRRDSRLEHVIALLSYPKNARISFEYSSPILHRNVTICSGFGASGIKPDKAVLKILSIPCSSTNQQP